MKRWVALFALALLAGAFFAGRASVRADPEDVARQRADSIEHARTDSLQREAASLAAARIAELETARRARHTEAARAGQAVTSLIDTVTLMAPDTLAPMLERLGALHEQEIEAHEKAHAADSALIAEQAQRILAMEVETDTLRAQRDRAMARAAGLLRAARQRRCGLGGAAGYGATSQEREEHHLGDLVPRLDVVGFSPVVVQFDEHLSAVTWVEDAGANVDSNSMAIAKALNRACFSDGAHWHRDVELTPESDRSAGRDGSSVDRIQRDRPGCCTNEFHDQSPSPPNLGTTCKV